MQELLRQSLRVTFALSWSLKSSGLAVSRKDRQPQARTIGNELMSQVETKTVSACVASGFGVGKVAGGGGGGLVYTHQVRPGLEELKQEPGADTAVASPLLPLANKGSWLKSTTFR